MKSWQCGSLVFIDESGAKTNMTRIRGRAERGARAYDSAPHGHWCVRTMISSVRSDGATACMTVDSATDREAFIAYVRDVLVPTLRSAKARTSDALNTVSQSDALSWFASFGYPIN